MAQTIKLKRSAVAGRIPSASDLELGEVALNTTDGKLYIKTTEGSLDSVIQVGSSTDSYTKIRKSVTQSLVVKVVSKTADHTWHGSGSSAGYNINGVESPQLHLVAGNTYRFDQSDSSNSGHPLRFYYEADKTTAYTVGVTTSGTPGNTGAYTQIIPTDTTPVTLHYQCSAHAYMGGRADFSTRNFTGFDTADLTEGSNLYYTNARARGAVSITDAGGDGSLAYNSSTGVITYTGPSASEVRAHISAGTGVSISSGAISIGQAVATSSNVQFNDLQVDGNAIITGNLTVNGTQTVLNTATLSVEDLNITVGKAATTSSATNGAGLTFGAWSSGTIPTFTWDHSNQRFAANYAIAANLTGNVTGNVSGSAGTVTSISSHSIGDLGNVSSTAASSGQVLKWSGSEWAPAADNAGGGAVNGFQTVAVAGQSSVVADSTTDTLNLAAGTGITLTTNAGSDTVTITGTSAGANAFGNIAVSGQSTVAADSTNDTLTLVAGSNMTLTTSASGDTVTFASASGGSAAADAIMIEHQFTATNNQTTFSGNDDNSVSLSYTANAIQVFLNGVLLDNGIDYTATNSTSVVLAEAATTGDFLQVIAFKKKISNGDVTVDALSGNGSSTAYTLSVDPGVENNTRVYIDGVYQSKANYSISGTTLTFSTAPPNGTAIEVEIGSRDISVDNTSAIGLLDNVKLKAGTGNDLEIFHDASNSYIKDVGTGNLKISSNNQIDITKGTSETMASFVVDGAVTLYHDNAAKIATSATGVTITGAAAATTFSGDLSGTINTNTTAATQSAGNNSTKVATTAYVDVAIAALGDSAPSTLNTLNELAAALGDDANFATTTATALGLRVSKTADTGAAVMPVGTTAQRPTAAAGQFRYNSTLGKFEGYTDAWGEIGGGGAASFAADNFTGNGSTTAYALTTPAASEDNLLVFIEGVFQQQNAFSIATSGGTTTLTFSAAPANGNSIIIYRLSPAVSGTNLTSNTMTGDGSDTTLTLSAAPVNENNTQVFVNGVYQNKSTYSISGTTLTFSEAPPTGALVECMTMNQLDINVPVDDSITSAKLSGNLTTPGTLAVTGGITATTTDNSSNLTLISTDADAVSGPVLEFFRNSASPADNDATGLVYFYGENDASEKIAYGQIYTQIKDMTDGTEDGSIDFYTMTAGTSTSKLLLNPTEVVINEGSTDLDFRVESDNSTHALFVQGSDGNVGIGMTPPTDRNLSVYSTTNSIVSLHNSTTGTAAGDGFQLQLGGNDAYFVNYEAGGFLSFYTAPSGGSTTERMRIDSSGSLLINSTATADTGGIKLFSNSGVNAAPATSGTTQTGGALRLRGANNAVLDMGLNSVYTWIQATDKANLANGYSLTLNPNGGNVGIGTMLPAAALHVDTAANVTTGFGAPLIKVGGDNSWAGNGSLYSVGFGYTDNSIASKSPAEIGLVTTTNAGYTKGDLVFATRNGTSNVAPAERMRVSAEGYVTKPYHPAFNAYHPAATAVGNVIICGTTRTNIGNHYSTTTGAFTAPVAGVYHFTFAILVSGSDNTDYHRVLFEINASGTSTTYGDNLEEQAGSSYSAAVMSVTIYLNALDYIRIRNQGSATYGTNYGNFSGHLVG